MQIGAVVRSPTPAYNPKPPGRPQPGGATEAVRALLAKNPGRWWAYRQIQYACPEHSKSAVDWALIRLRRWGEIEAATDWGRNARYLRYRLTVDQKKGRKA